MAEGSVQVMRVEEQTEENDVTSGGMCEPQDDLPSPRVCNSTTEILTSQLLKHHRDIQVLETKLKEVLEMQKELVDGIVKENSKYKETFRSLNFNAMFNEISIYTKKLIFIRNEMAALQDRATRLKQRATTVKENQEQRVKQMREAKALQEERERMLTAKPVWEVDQSLTPDMS